MPISGRHDLPLATFKKNLNPSCCRSRGGMRAWPVPRPTHAPATTLKTNGNSVPSNLKPLVSDWGGRRRRHAYFSLSNSSATL